MQTQRLFEILYILLQKRKTTAKELAELFEVSIRTIYRDLDVLTLAGIPIYTNKGRNGGIFLNEDYVLQKGILSDEEQQKILSALQSLQIADKEDTSKLLTKLSGVFQKEDTPWITIDFSDWNSTAQDQESFQLLKCAILSHHTISFRYFDSYGKEKQRLVEPLQLLFKGQAWYLVAYCKEKKAQRTFKIKRMRDIVTYEEIFKRNLQPIERNYHQYHQTLCNIVLKFHTSLGYRVYEEFPIEDIKIEENHFIVHTKFPEGEMMIGILLSYGDAVEVIEPIELREKLKKAAIQIANLY